MKPSFESLPELVATLIEQNKQILQGMDDLRKGHVPEAEQEKPITTKELCEYLGVSEPTIIRMKKKKLIPFFTVGGTSVRYNLTDVIKALEKNSK